MDKIIDNLIIVEGKTDTQKLQKIYGKELKTFETNGLQINQKTIKLIKSLAQSQKIIVFTDPDGPGKRIREFINSNFDGEVANAFINKKDIKTNSRKIGIAEAPDEAIIHALDNLLVFSPKTSSSITWNEYLVNDFYLKKNRLIICQYFNFDDETNAKTLFKWLNWMQINKEDLSKITELRNKNRC